MDGEAWLSLAVDGTQVGVDKVLVGTVSVPSKKVSFWAPPMVARDQCQG